MNKHPLRYNISSWRQLPQCLSNNSRHLHIHTTDFMFSDPDYAHPLRGFRISVDHEFYGTLFACMLNAKGDIVSPINTDCMIEGPISYELSTSEILSELAKFGFIISYEPRKHLSGSQLQYLMTLKGLHFDKLRRLAVNALNDTKVYLVVFNSKDHPQWLNNGYSPNKHEFSNALLAGTALNISEILDSKRYSWDWLDYVANIDDILKDNAGDNIYGD